MLENVAVQVGIIVIVATSLYTLMMWFIGAISGIGIEEVSLLTQFGKPLFKRKINKADISLGYVPFGSYVKLKGILPPEDNDPGPHSNEFRSKPFLLRLLILLSGPVVLFVIGWMVLSSNTQLSLGEIISIYLKTNFFMMPVDEGQALWMLLSENVSFLLGFIFLLLGTSNLLTNVGPLAGGRIPGFLALLTSLSGFILMLGGFRVFVANFSFLSLVYFLVAGILTGIIIYLIYMAIAKFLPNPL